jgi:pyrrolidone-carboxylate peptidase
MVRERSQLRIQDLKAQVHPGSARVMNVKVPSHMAAAIDQLTKQLGTTKTDVVIALLNEGLAVAQDKLKKR